MRKTKRRLTPKERFERVLNRKLGRIYIRVESEDRAYYIEEYKKAREKADTVIKSAEAVAKRVKIEELHDAQLVFVGRASRPLYATLKKASEKLGLNPKNIKLVEFSSYFGMQTDLRKQIPSAKAFVEYIRKMKIGVGKKPKPVMIIDAAGITGRTADLIAKAIMMANPNVSRSNVKTFYVGFSEIEREKILLKKPVDMKTAKERGIEFIFENWPHPVEPVSEYIGKGKKAKPIYEKRSKLEHLKAWIYEQARQHRLKEWLKEKKET